MTFAESMRNFSPRLLTTIPREWLVRLDQTLVSMAVVAFLIVLPSAAVAQDGGPEGKTIGNYNIQQTLEVGKQLTQIDTHADFPAYATFVNLNDGVRVFEHTVSLRSRNHKGVFFDDLFSSSFGYGGDPNNVTRVRLSKNKWYDFSSSFRRDRNVWNYLALANPLNPLNTAVNPGSIGSHTALNLAFPAADPLFVSSPHAFDTTRRMSDFDLMLAPQSRFRLRVGYSHYIEEGPALSSFPGGTEISLYQNTHDIQDSYRVGLDFRFIHHTTITYDQTVQHYKQNTFWTDAYLPSAQTRWAHPIPYNSYQLPTPDPVTGTSVFDLGLTFWPLGSPSGFQPCTTPIISLTTTPATGNPSCNGSVFYSRTQPLMSTSPTEQLSLQSDYFKSVHFMGRLAYSSTDLNYAWSEMRVGLATLTNERLFHLTGSGSGRRISVTGNGGVTVDVTEKFQISDTLHFNDWRLPTLVNLNNNTLFGTSMTTLPPDSTGRFFPTSSCNISDLAACPSHSGSSPADISSELFARYLAQKVKTNLFDLQYRFNKRIGTRLAYRYTDRLVSFRTPHWTIPSQNIDGDIPVTQSVTFYPGPTATSANRTPVLCPASLNNAAGICQNTIRVTDPATYAYLATIDPNFAVEPWGKEDFPIHEYSALAGIWARPFDNLRLNFDVELTSADQALTRVSPQQYQHYNFRARYALRPWFTLNGSVDIIENSNNVTDTHNLQHTRNYGFGGIISKKGWSLDFGYNYYDYFSTTDICFVASYSAQVPQPAGLVTSPCPPAMTPGGAANYLFTHDAFRDGNHYGYANLIVKPVKRVTLTFGSDFVHADGASPLTNPFMTLGPQQSNYARVSEGIAIELAKGFTWKTNFRHYNYNEKGISPTSPVATGDFDGHIFDLSLRYSF